jgi:hypothetical protein
MEYQIEVPDQIPKSKEMKNHGRSVVQTVSNVETVDGSSTRNRT